MASYFVKVCPVEVQLGDCPAEEIWLEYIEPIAYITMDDFLAVLPFILSILFGAYLVRISLRALNNR